MKSQQFDEISQVLGSDKIDDLLQYLNSDQISTIFDSVDLDALARGDFNFYLDFEENHKVFSTYLVNSEFVRPHQLYDQFGDVFKKRSGFQNAKIYFIAKRKKMRLFLDSTYFEEKNLKFSISIDNEDPITYQISLDELLLNIQLPILTQLFIVPVSSHFQYRMLRSKNDLRHMSGIMIDKLKSDENNIVINIYTPFDKCIQVFCGPHQLLNMTKIFINDDSEILYVGQSHNMPERIISHEKVQRALAEAEDNEDIYIYFFSINERVIFAGEVLGIFDENFGDVNEITNKSRVNLVEMVLINYFRPEYNTTFVNSEIPLNNQVDNFLRKNEYTRMIVEVNCDSKFFRFGSSTVRAKQQHMIVHKLDR